MESELENKKECHSCHQLNKKEARFCHFCGAELEGGQYRPAGVGPTTVTAETNKQEVTETLRGSVYTKFGISLGCIAVLGILFLVGCIALINYDPPEESPEAAIGAGLGAAALGIMAFICLVPGLIYIIVLFTGSYHEVGATRTFTISDQTIKIMIPDISAFQIPWSDIATVQIYKSESWSDWRRYSGHRTNPSGKTLVYVINFYGRSGYLTTYAFVRGLDFSGSSTRRIVSLIEQYAYRLQKEYIWGKKIEKVRQKRMRKQGKL
jgi:hypothetical protein